MKRWRETGRWKRKQVNWKLRISDCNTWISKKHSLFSSGACLSSVLLCLCICVCHVSYPTPDTEAPSAAANLLQWNGWGNSWAPWAGLSWAWAWGRGNMCTAQEACKCRCVANESLDVVTMLSFLTEKACRSGIIWGRPGWGGQRNARSEQRGACTNGGWDWRASKEKCKLLALHMSKFYSFFW